jgi:hypothetical protein
MARIVLNPAEKLATGKREIDLPAMPVAARYLSVSLKRSAWPDTGADVVRVSVEVTEDGGATWQFLYGFTARGGEPRDKNGAVQTHSRGGAWRHDEKGNAMPLFPGVNPRRRVRVTVEPLVELDTEVVADIS